MIRLAVRKLALGCAAAFLALVVAVPAARAAQPVELVETFHKSLLDVMKSADQLKVQGRYDRLAEPIEETFNLPVMIQIASGNKWRTAGEEEKKKLIEAFKRVSVATYASRFDGFSGERFEMLGEREGPSGSRLVLTRIVRPNEEPVPITYVTRKYGDGWQVVDVIVSGGISELAVRRSEYNAILDQGGTSELIARLNQKADDMLRN